MTQMSHNVCNANVKKNSDILTNSDNLSLLKLDCWNVLITKIFRLSSSSSELLYVAEELVELVPGLVWAVINHGAEEPTRCKKTTVNLNEEFFIFTNDQIGLRTWDRRQFHLGAKWPEKSRPAYLRPCSFLPSYTCSLSILPSHLDSIWGLSLLYFWLLVYVVTVSFMVM